MSVCQVIATASIKPIDVEGMERMNVFDWARGLFSKRGRAVACYRRGMEKAKARDHQGAIEDYTTAIESTSTPPDVQAMALYNRALAYVAGGDNAKGQADLNQVLRMDGAHENVKAMAKQKAARMDARADKADS